MGKRFDFTGKRFLIAEDDIYLRESVETLLKSVGGTVRTAENGLVAKTILDLNKDSFDLVISDVRMPEMDGLALLKYVLDHHPNLPFIVFTGFSEVLEAKSAFDHGAKGFLAKPFRLEEMLHLIESVLSPQTPSTPPNEQDELALEVKYCKIRVEEFLSASRLPSDIYIKVARAKFLKVAKENSEIDVGRIKTYQDKKLDYFYVAAEDFHKYSTLSLRLAKVVGTSSKIPAEKRMQLFRHTSEILLQEIFVNGLSSTLCEDLQSMVKNTLTMVSDSDDLFALLLNMEARGDRMYAHSLSVTCYTHMIAKRLGWHSTANIYKLSLSSLFHDIGFKELPEELFEKSRAQMTSDEVKLYETHPGRSRDILLSIHEFPDDLAQIVYQHHETLSSSGYPTKPIVARIHPLAKVIRIADEISEQLFGMTGTPNINCATALRKIHELKAAELDTVALAAAFDAFAVDRPKELISRSA